MEKRTLPCDRGAMNDLPILYVKRGCPYCEEAEAVLNEKGIAFLKKEVLSDPQAMDEMREKSAQTKAPTLDWHGEILADFGVEELMPFLERQGVELEDS